MTLTSISELLAVAPSLPVLTTWVCRGLDSQGQPFACSANAQSDCATAPIIIIKEMHLNDVPKPLLIQYDDLRMNFS